MAKLTPAEIEAALPALRKWHLADGKLVHDYTFSDFSAAMAFVNKVAALAESANHHPDIDIRYNQVCLALISHDAGGITERDVKFATALNEAFPPKASGVRAPRVLGALLTGGRFCADRGSRCCGNC